MFFKGSHGSFMVSTLAAMTMMACVGDATDATDATAVDQVAAAVTADSGFDADGFKTTAFGGSLATSVFESGTNKLVAVGRTTTTDGQGFPTGRVAIARYQKSTGARDTTLVGGNRTQADGCTAYTHVLNGGQEEIDSSCAQSMEAYAAVPYGNDIVIAGSADAFIPGSTNRERRPLLMRVSSTGAVVWSWMPRLEQTSNNYRLQGLTIANGVITATGWMYTSSGISEMVVVRLTVDGNPDASFPYGPIVRAVDASLSTADTTYSPQGVSVLASGQIVVAGYTQSKSSGAYRSLLASFASTGVKQGFATPRSGELLRAIKIDGTGRVVVGGSSVVSGPTQFLAERYTIGGTGGFSLDGSFGVGGLRTIKLGTAYADANAIAFDANGRIVLAGSSSSGTGYIMQTARLTSGGAIDTTYTSSGTAGFNFSGSSSEAAFAVAVQSDGKVTLAGAAANEFGLVRFDP
jgi:uncharacterized delta-60 repeat protein